MKTSHTLIWLSSLIMVLALIAAGVGLFWQEGGRPFTFTTLRGETVQIYGQGLYRYDTSIVAIGLKMADAVTLVLAIPLCLLALVLYQHGSLKGGDTAGRDTGLLPLHVHLSGLWRCLQRLIPDVCDPAGPQPVRLYSGPGLV